MAPMYYRGASAAILVYDVTNSDSFDALPGWVKGSTWLLLHVRISFVMMKLQSSRG